MAMGDLVLAPDEEAGVMSKLQQGGVERTALHNHLNGESPRVMYMHIMAKGNAQKSRRQSTTRWHRPTHRCRRRQLRLPRRQPWTPRHFASKRANPVLRALKTNGIAVVALHSHL